MNARVVGLLLLFSLLCACLVEEIQPSIAEATEAKAYASHSEEQLDVLDVARSQL